MMDRKMLQEEWVAQAGISKITHDSLGLRVGTIMRAFENENKIVPEFSQHFEHLDTTMTTTGV
jgi:hypothetical protein